MASIAAKALLGENVMSYLSLAASEPNPPQGKWSWGDALLRPSVGEGTPLHLERDLPFMKPRKKGGRSKQVVTQSLW